MDYFVIAECVRESKSWHFPTALLKVDASSTELLKNTKYLLFWGTTATSYLSYSYIL